MKIACLDHGYVRLVEHMGSDLSVARSARVSYDAAWRAGEDEGSDAKLIRYLWKHKHTSPFEAPSFQFEVKAPIFVFRQWHRHRTWCLVGDTRVHFRHPSGKLYHKTMRELAEAWWISEQEVKRPDKQIRTMREFQRDRIRNMRVECIQDGKSIAQTSITDVILSGRKEVYRLTSECGKEIVATLNHRFLTTGGWQFMHELKLGDKILTVARIAREERRTCPVFQLDELKEERWSQIVNDVQVSTLGRAQRRGKELIPHINTQGRAVVSVKQHNQWGPVQVSQLVAEAFLSGSGFVLHKDDCPSNNRISNLKFGSNKDNHDDAKRNGRRVYNGVTTLLVASVESAGIEMTYDIEVDHPDHNFIAEGFCVHNSYNEMSARYTELPEEYYVPDLDKIGQQSKSTKQARTFADVDPKLYLASQLYYERHCHEAFATYHALLKTGWPRELARGVLPVAAYSIMFAKVNLLNLFKFLTLRLDSHAQYEIQVYAQVMLDLIRPIVPVCVAAWEEECER